MASFLHASLPQARSASFISEIVQFCQHRQQQSVCRCCSSSSTSTSASSFPRETFAIASAKAKKHNSGQSWLRRDCSRRNASVVNSRITISDHSAASGGGGSSSGVSGGRHLSSGDIFELVSSVCRPSSNLGEQGKKRGSISAAAGADLAEAAGTGTDKEQEKKDELPEKLREIVRLFQEVKDPRAKYEQLLYYAKRLRPLAKEFCTKENKVEGCVSQVWVLPSFNAEESTVAFEADSDSVLTKGLAALLVEGLSGAKVAEVLKVSPEFIQMLGLKQSLTPSRSNGFFNMLKLMQKKTLQMYMQAEGAKLASSSSSSAAAGAGIIEETRAEGRAASSSVNAMNTRSESGMSKSGANSAPDASPGQQTSRKLSIEKKLQEALAPTVLVVDDVSHQHAGHAGVHKGATETHFNVKVVSDKFSGISLIKRHRLIYNVLDDEMKSGVHALSLITKSPSEPV